MRRTLKLGEGLSLVLGGNLSEVWPGTQRTTALRESSQLFDIDTTASSNTTVAHSLLTIRAFYTLVSAHSSNCDAPPHCAYIQPTTLSTPRELIYAVKMDERELISHIKALTKALNEKEPANNIIALLEKLKSNANPSEEQIRVSSS